MLRQGLLVLAALSLWAPAAPPDDERLAQHRRLSTPSEAHQRLSPLAGRWEFRSSYRTGPGEDPIVVTGTAEHEWILGGRFLECRSRSTSTGEKIEALLLLGHDRRTQRYTFTSFDTLSTYAVTGEGGWNRATYSFELRGETTLEPVMTGKQRYRLVIRIEDTDRIVIEMWFAYPGGEEVEGAEAIYTRVK